MQANALTAEVQTLADTVAANSATQFYAAGVTAGTNLVAGIESVVATYKIKLATTKTAKGVAKLEKSFTGDVNNVLAGLNFGMGTLMAEGGIVTGPTSIIAGEAGAEAIIPLDRFGDLGLGGNTNVTINVNGGDPNAVVDALRRYMQLNGSVPIRVSA